MIGKIKQLWLALGFTVAVFLFSAGTKYAENRQFKKERKANEKLQKIRKARATLNREQLLDRLYKRKRK